MAGIAIPELYIPMNDVLFRAAKSGDLAVIAGNNIPLLQATHEGNTVLHIAAKFERLAFFEEAFNQAPTLMEVKNDRGDTALHYAARAGCDEIVSFLVLKARDHVYSVGTPNDVGNTALHEAVQNTHQGVVNAMMREASGLAAVTNTVNGVSALYMAVERESRPIVELLLASLDVSFRGPNQLTALHSAVTHRNTEIADLLLQRKPALMRQFDDRGNSPLHFAAFAGHLEMVTLLVERDASTVYLTDNEGVSAIHVAASFGHLSIIQYLEKNCPDSVELTNNQGKNFFHLAVEANKLNIVKYVISLPELIRLLNVPDKDGNTPLHLAAISLADSTLGNPKLEGRRVLMRLMLTSPAIIRTSCAVNKDVQTAFDAILSMEPKSLPRMMMELLEITSLKNRDSWFSTELLRHIVSSTRSKKFNDGKLEDATKESSQNIPMVASLIATVTFAAAFTLPGGDNNNSGTVILSNISSFQVVFLFFNTALMIFALYILLIVINSKSTSEVSSLRISLGVLAAYLVLAYGFALYAVIADKDKELAILFLIVMIIAAVIFISNFLFGIFGIFGTFFLILLNHGKFTGGHATLYLKNIPLFASHVFWFKRGSQFQIIFDNFIVDWKRTPLRIGRYEIAYVIIPPPGVSGWSITEH